MLKRLRDICFFLLLIFIDLMGNEPFHYSINIESGLPSNEIYDITSDTNNIIWITTDRGVVKYDGYNYKYFTTADSLADNTNFYFNDVKDNQLWLSGFNRKLSYISHDCVHQYRFNKELLLLLEGNSDNWIKYICKRAEDYFFFTFRNGRGIEIFQFKLDEPPRLVGENKSLYKVLSDNEDGILIKFGDRQFFFFKDNGYYISQKYGVSCAQNDKKNNTYFHSKFKIFKRNIDGTTQKIAVQAQIEKIFIDNQNNLWACTRKGIFYYDNANLDAPPLQFFSDLLVSCIEQDFQGNYWAGTNVSGIRLISKLDIKKFTYGNSIEGNDNILRICDYKMNLAFGNSQSNLVICNKEDSCKVLTVPMNGNSAQLNKIDEWDKESLMLKGGLLFDGVSFERLNIESKEGVPYKNFGKKLLNGDIIVFTNNLKVVIYQSKTSLSFEHDFNNSILNTVSQSKNQSIWLGTMNGLFKVENYDYSNSFEIHDNNGGSLGRISNISIDTNNIVWVSTIGNGVIGIKENTTKCISELPYLSSQMVNKVLITNDSILWLATNNGIDVLSYHWDDTLSVKFIRNINNTDGLVSNYVNDLAFYNGRIWAATNKGMYRFSPDILKSEVPQIPISITQFENEDSIYNKGDDLVFDFDENDIKISYLGMSYQQQKDKIEYKYRLMKNENLTDAKWYYTYALSQRFNNLSAGEYVFEVTAKNKLKIWTENPAKVYFTITPRIIDTRLFKSLLLIFTVSVLAIVYKIQIKRIKQRQSRDKELALAKQNMQEAELSAIRNQMNPHFVFNSLNSIQNLIFKNDKEGTNYYLSQFSKLMRQSLQFTSLDFITIKKELTFLKNYLELESLRFPKKFEVIFVVSEQINSSEIMIPSLILQPIVENSIKHGFNNINYKGLIKIEAKLWDDNTLYLSVIDNGKGSKTGNILFRTNLKEHKSLGIEMVKNRINLLNKTRYQMKAEITQEITESGYATIFKMPILLNND